MPHRIAAAISYLFNPMVMPVLTLFLAAKSDPYLLIFTNWEVFQPALFIIGINTFLLPLITILLLKNQGVISTIDMRERSERFLPVLLSFLYYGFTYFFLRKTALDPVFFSMFFGCMVAMILSLLINTRFKISVHMVGICGVLGAVTALFGLHGFSDLPLFCSILLLAGILGTARLSLGAHRPVEVYMGSLVGFLSVYLTVRWEILV